MKGDELMMETKLKWLWFGIGFFPIVPILIITAISQDSLEKQLTWFFGMIGYLLLSILLSVIMFVYKKLTQKGNYLKPLISGVLVGLAWGVLLAGVVCY